MKKSFPYRPLKTWSTLNRSRDGGIASLETETDWTLTNLSSLWLFQSSRKCAYRLWRCKTRPVDDIGRRRGEEDFLTSQLSVRLIPLLSCWQKTSFVREGEGRTSLSTIAPDAGLLGGAALGQKLCFPAGRASTDLGPDLVTWTAFLKVRYVIEFTGPLDSFGGGSLWLEEAKVRWTCSRCPSVGLDGEEEGDPSLPQHQGFSWRWWCERRKAHGQGS